MARSMRALRSPFAGGAMKDRDGRLWKDHVNARERCGVQLLFLRLHSPCSSNTAMIGIITLSATGKRSEPVQRKNTKQWLMRSCAGQSQTTCWNASGQPELEFGSIRLPVHTVS